MWFGIFLEWFDSRRVSSVQVGGSNPPSHGGSGCAQQSVPSGSLKTADPGGNVTAAVGGCLMLLIVLLRAVPHSLSDSRLREAPQLYSLHI